MMMMMTMMNMKMINTGNAWTMRMSAMLMMMTVWSQSVQGNSQNMSDTALQEMINAPACWITTKPRGVGGSISECPEGLEQSGSDYLCSLLCYPPCPQGYDGVGPVCWNGTKPMGRGVGHILGCSNSTEYDTGLCYKKCPVGFHGKGPICWETVGFVDRADVGLFSYYMF
jgi:hypothetical protein